MADINVQNVDTKKRYPWEFWLVIGMLLALLLLLWVLLRQDIPKPDVSLLTDEGKRAITLDQITNYNTRMLAHQKDVLAIIITAFGAWVGAGAAYFFGRENLRVAADSLLAMREVSPRERLRRTSIKQIPPKPVDWTVKKTTPVDDVQAKLKNEPARWFIPIVKNDDTLETVMNEEAVWRFLLDPAGQPSAGKTVQDLLTYIESNSDFRRFRDIHVPVTMETTVGAASELMDSKHVFLAIVESEGKPTHFFTTSEVRKLILQAG